MECASGDQNDFIAKCTERETISGIRGMRGGAAKIRLGLAHHLHKIEYAVNIAAPAPHINAFASITDGEDKENQLINK